MKRKIDFEELKTIQLGVLEHVDSFCRENNIKYFLCGGSMIGAVRHKGYIPWDDDIDIMMLRDDYENFINEYQNKDKSHFKLHHYRKEPSFSYSFVKIEDSRTQVEEGVVNQTPIGVNIDLFPIDVVPQDENKRKRMFLFLSFLLSLITLKQVQYVSHRAWFKNVFLLISRFVLYPVPLSFIVRQIDKRATKYRGTDSPYCGISVWGYGMREINLRSNWDEVVYVPFENMKAPIPKGYDNYLSCVYGDYMKLPPEEKRITHHKFEAFWKDGI